MSVEPDRRVPAPDRRQVTRGGRRETDPALRHPEACPNPYCDGISYVISTRDAEGGWIRRRHECSKCKRRWPSWQTLIDPKCVDADVIDPSALKRYL